MAASRLPAVLAALCAASLAVAEDPPGAVGALAGEPAAPAPAPEPGPEPDPRITQANGTVTAAVLAGVDSFGPGMALRFAVGGGGPPVRVDAGFTVRFASGDLQVAGSAGPGAPGTVARASLELTVSRAHGVVRPWASAGFSRVAASVDGDTYALCDSDLCPSVDTEGPSGSTTGLELAAGAQVVVARSVLLGLEARWSAVDEVVLEGAGPVDVGGPWIGASLTARR